MHVLNKDFESAVVIAVFGLPGSGKSYFAERLANILGGEYISSDRLRREMFADRHYTPEEKARVYREMIRKMQDAIRLKKNAVLDATFHKRDARDLITSGTEQNVFFIEIRADEATIEQRLKEDRPYSEADFGVYQLVKNEWEPMEEDHLVLLSADENVETMLSKAVQYLKDETGTD